MVVVVVVVGSNLARATERGVSVQAGGPPKHHTARGRLNCAIKTKLNYAMAIFFMQYNSSSLRWSGRPESRLHSGRADSSAARSVPSPRFVPRWGVKHTSSSIPPQLRGVLGYSRGFRF